MAENSGAVPAAGGARGGAEGERAELSAEEAAATPGAASPAALACADSASEIHDESAPASASDMIRGQRVRLLRRKEPAKAGDSADVGTGGGPAPAGAGNDGRGRFSKSEEERSKEYEQARREIFGDEGDAGEDGDAGAPGSPGPVGGGGQESTGAVAEEAAAEAPEARRNGGAGTGIAPVAEQPLPAPRAGERPFFAAPFFFPIMGPPVGVPRRRGSLLGSPWLHGLPQSCAHGVLLPRYPALGARARRLQERRRRGGTAARPQGLAVETGASASDGDGDGDGTAAVPAASAPASSSAGASPSPLAAPGGATGADARRLDAAAPAFTPRGARVGAPTLPARGQLTPSSSVDTDSSGKAGRRGRRGRRGGQRRRRRTDSGASGADGAESGGEDASGAASGAPPRDAAASSGEEAGAPPSP